MPSVAAQTVKPKSANGDILLALTGRLAGPDGSILQGNPAFRLPDIGGDAACQLRFGLPNPEVVARRGSLLGNPGVHQARA